VNLIKKRIWSTWNASDWNEAYPIGNGRLGGMVFGSVGNENIQLNEDSIWYGSPVDRNNPDALENLPKIRELLFAGRIGEAENLCKFALSGTPESERPYQPMGNLLLEFDHDESLVEEYERELDLETAVVNVCYRVRDVFHKREYFSSAPDQVIVVRLSASQPGSISFSACLRRGLFLDTSRSVSDDTVELCAGCGKNAVEFCFSVRAACKGGRVKTCGEFIVVEEADEVILFLSAATSFRHADYRDVCRDYLDAAAVKTYEELLNRHIGDYRSYYGRMSLDLSGSDCRTDTELLPTARRLELVREGRDDPGLVSLYFQFGRYLMISSSRPGTLPANLQGIWNKDFIPAWGSKYTININLQMNYWPAEVCNLAECHMPLFDLLERMVEPGRKTARMMYGCRGFTAHHNTDIWADTAPQDIWIPATYWPMGAAWLCLHCWEHYEYDPDIDFLKKVYPVMKEAAVFFLDYLVEDGRGRLVTCPSVSPENSYRLPNGETGSVCIGPSMDSQIIRELMEKCIKAAELLGCDEDFSSELERCIERLPVIEVDRFGRIMEWSEEYEEVEPGHRHISHLFALHPAHQITLKGTPGLAAAARKTLEWRLSHGGGHTGWSRAWIINLWARLSDGESAWKNVMKLLSQSTLPNMFDNHPPFQIDGNFGGTAGIAEMMMQSHDNEVSLLPALPDAWACGAVKGLRARNGLTVDLDWKDGSLSAVSLHPLYSGNHRVCYKDKVVDLQLEAGITINLGGSLNII
jgi:alpha-L-fucosidase 2